MSEYCILLIIFGFIYESFSWLFRIQKSAYWIKKERLHFKNPKIVNDSRCIYIILPVLAEMDILEDTSNYFHTNFLQTNKNIRLVIVTTEKEKLVVHEEKNTITIAQDLVKKYENIMHIHYPNEVGKMAHQLNYAINTLIHASGLKPDDFLAIYNADSRPEKETFDWVLQKIQHEKISAFQQYGCYSGNFSQLYRNAWSSVLLSGAVWQTRWAIGFEIYNSLKQFRFKDQGRIKMNYPFNYCIGHGLFITKEIFELVGGFNESTHNEDAIIGLQLSDKQIVLMPIPYFDISESPDTLEMLYKQKSNWYFGPLQAYAYVSEIIQKSTQYGIQRKVRLFLLSTRLFFHAFYWILGPSFVLLSSVLSIADKNIFLFLLTLFSVMVFSVPSIIAYRIIFDLHIDESHMHIKNMKSLILRGFIICYMMHGASAYRGLFKYLKQIFTGENAVKEKTIIHRIQ